MTLAATTASLLLLAAAAGPDAHTRAKSTDVSRARNLSVAVARARTPAARRAALLRVMDAVHVGVVSAAGAPRVVAGGAGAAGAFHLYDFELTTLARALADGRTRTFENVASALTAAGLGLAPSTPFPAELLREALAADVRRPAAASLTGLLIRELGLRRQDDPVGRSPIGAVKLDALQTWLLSASIAVPLLAELPARAAKTRVARASSTLADTCKRYRDAEEQAKKQLEESKGKVPAWVEQKITDKILDNAKDILVKQADRWTNRNLPTWANRLKWKHGKLPSKATQLLTILHGSLLALSIDVSAPEKADPVHWGHGGPGGALEFQVTVVMLDDYGELLVKCGALAGLELPPKGPIENVTVSWQQAEGDIKAEGTLDCPVPAIPIIGSLVGRYICTTQTGKDGVARVRLITNIEDQPPSGLQSESSGVFEGVALYQSASGGGVAGWIGQFLFPKTGGGTRWFVRSHPCSGVRKAAAAARRTSVLQRSAAQVCPIPPQTISGTVAGSNTYDPIKVAWNGSATFTFQPNEPFSGLPWPEVGDNNWHYTLTSGSVTWSATVTPGSACAVSGGGTLGPGDMRGELLINAPDSVQESPGWRYETIAGPAPGVTMPMVLTCAGDPDPIVSDLNAVDWAGGSATLHTIYNGYSTGQPVTNRYTPDLRLFSGSILTPTGEQTWTWALTGTGNAGS